MISDQLRRGKNVSKTIYRLWDISRAVRSTSRCAVSLKGKKVDEEESKAILLTFKIVLLHIVLCIWVMYSLPRWPGGPRQGHRAPPLCVGGRWPRSHWRGRRSARCGFSATVCTSFRLRITVKAFSQSIGSITTTCGLVCHGAICGSLSISEGCQTVAQTV